MEVYTSTQSKVKKPWTGLKCLLPCLSQTVYVLLLPNKVWTKKSFIVALPQITIMITLHPLLLSLLHLYFKCMCKLWDIHYTYKQSTFTIHIQSIYTNLDWETGNNPVDPTLNSNLLIYSNFMNSDNICPFVVANGNNKQKTTKWPNLSQNVKTK